MAMLNTPDPGPILNDIRLLAATGPGRHQPIIANAETNDGGRGNV